MSALADLPLPQAAWPPGLDLEPATADAARLARHAAIAPFRAGRLRAAQIELVWHDSPDGALAAAGLVLCEQHLGRSTAWRLERLHPLPPGIAAAPVAEAADPSRLGHPLPAMLAPIAACTGTVRTLPAGAAPLEVRLLDGRLRSVAREQPVCRLWLDGAAGTAEAPAIALAESGAASVPAQTLAAAALALAGRSLPAPPLGLPRLVPEMLTGEAFALIAGHLAGVLRHHAPAAAAGGQMEPVHQMRVALRRLRSAMALFRRAVDCPELTELKPALRGLSRALGPARDWDVFIAGVSSSVARALPEEPAIERLRGAAERRRQDAYAALRDYLEGPAFAAALLRLVCLAGRRPWLSVPQGAAEGDGTEPEEEAARRQAATQAMTLAQFAPHALSRRLSHVLAPGADLSALSVADLHALRIEGKRLRYAAEFFAPLYPAREARRFIRRVSLLQDRLGRLNDEAVAGELMAQLGGGGRSYAAGLVRGYVAAARPDAEAGMARAWRKFRRLEAFWA